MNKFLFSTVSFAVVATMTGPIEAGPPETLGRLQCTHDQIAKYDGVQAKWVCGALAPQWVVRDRDGDQVGDVVQAPEDVAISFEVAGKTLWVDVRFNRLQPRMGSREIEEYSNHELPDCSDGPYYRTELFDINPSIFILGFDAVAYTWNRNTDVIDIVEPAGAPFLLNFEAGGTLYVKLESGECRPTNICPAPTPCTANPSREVYGGITVVAPDIFLDYPEPYTVEMQ